MCRCPSNQLDSQRITYRRCAESAASGKGLTDWIRLASRRKCKRPPSPAGVCGFLVPARGSALLARRLTTALAQAHLLGEVRPRLGVVGGDHRIVLRQAPLRPIFLGAHVVLGAQVPLQRLELAAILKTDKEVRGDRATDRNRN